MDYEELSLAVQKGKAKLVKELVNKGLEEGAPVKDILEKGLISAMGIVGDVIKEFENGAVGPSKDCAYENVYLKAITGTLLKRSGR